jgi:hypothetical protein
MSGMSDYYKNLDSYLQANTNHIQHSMENQRISVGAEFLFDSSNRGSFRSLADSNGYESDVDESQESAKKRFVFIVKVLN